MPNVIVHNISNRVKGVQAHAVVCGGFSVRPGKFITVDKDLLNAKHMDLHGSVLWVGDLPKRYLAKKVEESPALEQLTKQEVRDKLLSMSLEDLQKLASCVTPALTSTSRKGYAYAILAACFSAAHDLDPEAFFWLNRWTKATNGDFVEV